MRWYNEPVPVFADRLFSFGADGLKPNAPSVSVQDTAGWILSYRVVKR